MIDFAKLAAPFDPVTVVAFLDKVMPEPNSGCWFWTGSQNKQGYGNFWVGKKCQKAHRVSYLLFKGEIPAGLDVLHACDMPSCVNHDHLRAGTTQDNMRDMWRKGRGNPPARGRNPKARLTEDGVQRIREMAWLEYKTSAIADLFKISASQVRRVVRRAHGGWR